MFTLCLDTSVLSAYFDDREQERKNFTQQWWHYELPKYRVYLTAVTLAEIHRNRSTIKERMLKLIEDFMELPVENAIEEIVEYYISKGLATKKHLADVTQIAYCVVHKIDFLATWNCQELANAHRKRRLRSLNAEVGWFTPEIATPYELIQEG
jgi:predicted nucleic acid-binding protein